MKFITFSEKEVTQSSSYTSLNKPHLMISIRDPKRDIVIPNSHYCKETLILNFVDEEDFVNDKICFDSDLARQILDFVDAHIHKVQMLVIHCQAGLSRSVAIASALSKIINCMDDTIFSNGIPNMLVYTTLLTEYFTEKNPEKRWPSIFLLRERSMKESLSPSIYRIHEYKTKQRAKQEV